ncbi:MAG: WYL domain-containing protein [Bacteroides sp.]|nr:WYL domain-containing protein [Bacteroides sp.]
MKSLYEPLTRQMLLVSKLERAGKALPADVLFDFLEKESHSHDFSYPSERRSKMRQLQRDIEDIRSLFHITISRIGKSDYKITDTDRSPVNYKRLFDDFDLLTAVSPDSDINRHVIPERSRNKGSDLLRKVLSSIKNKCLIEFDYVNYRSGCSERHHKIAPHFLKEDQSLWYVVGYENDKLLLFALDRIKNFNVTDEEFKFDESLDLTEIFKDSYGIWADPSMPTEEVELRYDALDGSFLKARPLHPSQKVIVDNSEEFRITVNLKITNDFVMALLSRSRSLEVIRPQHLRQRVHDTLAAALARNS